MREGEAPVEVDLSKIRVDGFRTDFDEAEMQRLIESIDYIGLINPVALTSDYRVIDGRRRMRAFELMGFGSIPAVFPQIDESEVALLVAERDANETQVKYSPSEIAKLGAAIEERKRNDPEFESREGEGAGRPPKSNRPKVIASTGVDAIKTGPRLKKPSERLNDAVGQAFGVSGKTYQRIKDVHSVAEGEKDDAPEVIEEAKRLVQELDSGVITPNRADTELRAKRQEVQAYKGRGNEKKQLKAVDQLKLTLGGVADGLEAHFTSGFEKTFTPEIATESVTDMRANIARINKILKTLETHGKTES